MTLLTNILLLFMINIVHGDPLSIQIKQEVKSNNCPCDGCCDIPYDVEPWNDEPQDTTVGPTTEAPCIPYSIPTTNCSNYTAELIGDTWYIFFACGMNFTQAWDYCCYHGWSLATPDDDNIEFDQVMPDGAEFWLDVKPDPNNQTVWWWQTSPPNKTTPAQWMYGYVETAPPNCASHAKGQFLFNFDCSSEWYYVCQTDFFIDQRNRVEEVYFPPNKGKERDN